MSGGELRMRGRHRRGPFADGPARRRFSLLLVLAMVLGMASTAQLAGPPTAEAAAPNGYVPLPNWTIASNENATTTMPGNAAGLGTVTGHNDSYLSQAMWAGTDNWSLDGVIVPRLLPTQDSVTRYGNPCVQGKPVNQINQCSAHGFTVTLPRPLVDPIIAIGMGGGGWNSPSACTQNWYDVGVTSINGAAPTAGAVTAPYGTGNYAFAGNRLSLPQSYVNNRCDAPTSPVVYLQLKGLVTSYSLDNYYMGAVTANPTGEQVSASAIGGLRTNTYAPPADLSISKTGPASAVNGGPIQWSINVTNNGPQPSHGFIVRDAVPAGVTNPSLVSAPPGCTLTGSDLYCSAAPPSCTISPDATVTT